MSPHTQLVARTQVVASPDFHKALEAAADNAADVDRRGRFPSEAMEALRSAGALG